ncbi:hypothetical protein [Flagellimonas sp.]|uniref:hypothetical protein n=1 Tax=Flagellimonas sp. TaxID=2058762 RepID=UPI003B51237A
MIKRELYWLLGILGLVFLIIVLLFGLDGFDPDSTFDINIHDTYLVISKVQFTLLILVSVFFTIYLFRTFRNGFKNFTVNIIAMVATIVMLLVLDGFVSFLDMLITPYDPMERELLSRASHPVERFVSVLSTMAQVFQVVLLVFLGYCGFKAGRNYQAKK